MLRVLERGLELVTVFVSFVIVILSTAYVLQNALTEGSCGELRKDGISPVANPADCIRAAQALGIAFDDDSDAPNAAEVTERLFSAAVGCSYDPTTRRLRHNVGGIIDLGWLASTAAVPSDPCRTCPNN